MPKVSVIIPTYNREKYIVETLQSVFEQTFTDYEVIVIDDGSTDNTADVLRPYLDRIVYIRKPNGGQGSARNAGIKMAKGAYIAFLDSDDLWMPEKLLLQVSYLDEHPDVALVFSDAATFYDDEGNHVRTGELHFQGEDISFNRLFKMNFIPNLTVMVRKRSVEEAGLFDESKELVGGEDYEMWLRIAMKSGMGHIPKILAQYRQHGDNVLGMDLLKVYSMHRTVINKILECYPDIIYKFNIDMDEYYRNYNYILGRHLYQIKRYRTAVKHLRTALYYSPFAPKAWVLFFLSLIGGIIPGRKHIKVIE